VLGSKSSGPGRSIAVLTLLGMVVVFASCRRTDATGPGTNPDNYPVTSHFLQNQEGWTAEGDGIMYYSPTGGNPSSTGYIFIIDQTRGDNFYFKAPSKFLGNVSGAYNGLLTFELVWSETSLSNYKDGDDVVLSGSGMALVASLPEVPGTTWTSYSIPLNVAGGWVHQGTEQVATAAEIQSVLNSLQSLMIRGEFRSGAEQGGLDNVMLGVQP
jgi:hypothetical protein